MFCFFKIYVRSYKGVNKHPDDSCTGICPMLRQEEKSRYCCLRAGLEGLCILLLSLEPSLVICPRAVGALHLLVSYKAIERAAQTLKQTGRIQALYWILLAMCLRVNHPLKDLICLLIVLSGRVTLFKCNS